MDMVVAGQALADFPLLLCAAVTLALFVLAAIRMRRLPYLDCLVNLLSGAALIKLTHKQPVVILAWVMLLGGVYLSFRAVMASWTEFRRARGQRGAGAD